MEEKTFGKRLISVIAIMVIALIGAVSAAFASLDYQVGGGGLIG